MSTGYVFTSARDAIEEKIEGKDHSFHQLFLEDCARHGDRTAFICGMTGREVSFTRTLGMTKRLNGYFYHTLGIRAGDIVAMMVPNTPEYAAIFHGVIGLGAIISPLNSMFSAYEVEKQLRLSNAKALITVSHFEATTQEAVNALAEEQEVQLLVIDKSEVMKPDVQIDPVPEDYVVDSKPDDVVVLPFSSGTTGLPKGVQLTNRNLVANLFQTDGAITVDEKCTIMAVLPYFHIYGMIVILHQFIHGGGVQVVMPKFDMELYLDLVDKHKATHLFVAPPILVGFIKHPKTKTINMDHVQLVMSGAAPLGEDVQRMCEPLFPNATIGQGYGLTETSPVISVCPLETKLYGSAGTLVGSTEMRVVKVATEEGEENVNLGPDEGEGELWVRGPQVMKGYLKEEDTAIVFPEPGWFRTGDLVKVGEDGCIYVTDRIKELIKYKGYQVAPAELEALIQTHPYVQETIVVGIADKEEGAGNEVPKAHVVLKPTLSDEEKANAAEEIISFVAEKVAPYKKLRGGVKIVDSIPKTASGKLLRRVVKEQENAVKQMTESEEDDYYEEEERVVHVSDEQRELEEQIKKLQAELDEKAARNAALAADIAERPTVEYLQGVRSENEAELADLNDGIEVKRSAVGSLEPVRDRGYLLSARSHRLENYVVRCNMWIDGALTKEVEEEAANAERSTQAKVHEHIVKLQTSLHKAQRAVLELKEQINANGEALRVGHFREKPKVKGFETVRTGRSGFSRTSTARTKAPLGVMAQEIEAKNEEATAELIHLRQQSNHLAQRKAELTMQIKQSKGRLARDLKDMKNELNSYRSLAQRDRRQVLELEDANGTTTSTIEFLMGTLKVISGRSFTTSNGTSRASTRRQLK